jgi:hypothetical protein
MGRMDFLPPRSKDNTQKLDTEITERRTQRAQRKSENIQHLRNFLWNFPLNLCALCVLRGEMLFLPSRWKARAERAKLNAVNG